MSIEEQLRDILERIKGIEARLAQLEQGPPANPYNPWPSYPPTTPDRYWTAKPRCPVCGMDQSGPMGYVCYNPNCPSRVTCFTTTAGGAGHFYNEANTGPGTFMKSDVG